MKVTKESLLWRKSSHSNDTDCVEIAVATNGVGVRDSKDADGGQLGVTAAAFAAFLGTVRRTH